MRVSYQLFKVVMRSIKTSLGGCSGDVQFISQRRGDSVSIHEITPTIHPHLSSVSRQLRGPIRASRFLAVSHVHNIEFFAEPTTLGSTVSSPPDSVP